MTVLAVAGPLRFTGPAAFPFASVSSCFASAFSAACSWSILIRLVDSGGIMIS